MRLYHVSDHAEIILKEGFQDGPGFYRGGKLHRGVWLFAEPTAEGPEEPATTRTVVVEIPDEVAARYEWLEAELPKRKFLIPASVINRYLRPGD
jgi:hypothetical protein